MHLHDKTVHLRDPRTLVGSQTAPIHCRHLPAKQLNVRRSDLHRHLFRQRCVTSCVLGQSSPRPGNDLIVCCEVGCCEGPPGHAGVLSFHRQLLAVEVAGTAVISAGNACGFGANISQAYSKRVTCRTASVKLSSSVGQMSWYSTDMVSAAIGMCCWHTVDTVSTLHIGDL